MEKKTRNIYIGRIFVEIRHEFNAQLVLILQQCRDTNGDIVGIQVSEFLKFAMDHFVLHFLVNCKKLV